MSNKNKHIGWIVFFGLTAAAGVFYYYYTHSKKYYVMQIIKGGHGSYDGLMQLDARYLKEWAHAINTGNASFSIDGQNFDTNTGKRK